MDLKSKWNVLPRRDRIVFRLYLVLVLGASAFCAWDLAGDWPLTAMTLAAMAVMTALVTGAIFQKARQLQSSAAPQIHVRGWGVTDDVMAKIVHAMRSKRNGPLA